MSHSVDLESGLYVTATPIGNLEDITLRALEVLRAADLVLCEDTRVSGRLLSRHGIRGRFQGYHDHNAERIRPKILRRLEKGARIALISDAGTPLISDPGMKLVAAARAQGTAVYAVPGPSAATAALSVSGLPTDRFSFFGFLPGKAAARTKTLKEAARAPGTLVFFESARRLPASLNAMAAIFGPERPAAVCRELTKLHEEIMGGPISKLEAEIGARETLKGEIVVLIGPGEAETTEIERLDAAIHEALEHLSVREAASALSYATGLPRRKIYNRALELKEDDK